MFGDPVQWEELCEKGAEICASILSENPKTIILAHDTAYAHIPLKLYEKWGLPGELPCQVLWIPHATSWKYNGHGKGGNANWPERHEWELEALKKATACSYKVGYISQTIRQDLLGYPFQARESDLFYYPTGILLDKYLQEVCLEEIAFELQKRNIPLDKKIMFTIGRGNPLKGQDITLELYRHLKKTHPDLHLVMLAPYSDYMPEYVEFLHQRIKNEKLEVTLLDHYDSEIDACLYKWPNTVLTALLSRTDTQPLTVMESRANPKNAILLTSSGDRSGNQVENGVNGFVYNLDSFDEIIQCPLENSSSMEEMVNLASHIISLSGEERQAILDAGKGLIKEKYNMRTNVPANLEHLLQKIEKPLLYKKMQGGMINPPTLILSEKKSL